MSLVNEFPTNATQQGARLQRVGVVELPHLAQYLTTAGFDVISAPDFRGTVAAIRSHLDAGEFPVIIADVARPGLKAWIDRTSAITKTKVLRHDSASDTEYAAPQIHLPATIGSILSPLGLDAGSHFEVLVDSDGIVNAQVARPEEVRKNDNTDFIAPAPFQSTIQAPLPAHDPWLEAAQKVTPVPVAAVPVATPPVNAPAQPVVEADPWEAQRAAVLASAHAEIKAAAAQFFLEEQIVPIESQVATLEPLLLNIPEPVIPEPVAEPIAVEVPVEVPVEAELPAPAVEHIQTFTIPTFDEPDLFDEVEPVPVVASFETELPPVALPHVEIPAPPVFQIPAMPAPMLTPVPAAPVEAIPAPAYVAPPVPVAPVQPTPVPEYVAPLKPQPEPVREVLSGQSPVQQVNPIDFAINAPQHQYVPPAPQMDMRPRVQEMPSAIPSVANPEGVSTDLAPLVFIVSGRGGVGKTMLSMSLAQRAASVGGLRTILIDGNRAQGDIRVYLRLTRSQLPSVYDAALLNDPKAAIISPERLQAERGPALEHLMFGLALAPPDGMADPTVVRPDLYAGVIAAARQFADLVICDTQIIESVDQVGIVEDLVTPALRAGAWGLGISDLSAAGVHNLLDRLKTMNSAGVSRDRLLVTLNKVPHSGKYDKLRTEQAFNQNGNFLGAIEADDSVIEIMNSGGTTASHSAVAPILDECLYRITGEETFLGRSYAGNTIAKAVRPNTKKKKRWGRRG